MSTSASESAASTASQSTLKSSSTSKSTSESKSAFTAGFKHVATRELIAFGRTALIVGLGLGMAAAVTRASSTKYWEKRRALNAELKADQERLGLAGRDKQKALYAQFPTPEITLCKPVVIAPGATASVTMGGKFAEKTTFLSANDQVELEPGTLAAGRYTAKVTATADAAAGYAAIYAITPVSGANNACPAVFVAQAASYDLKADNGWTLKMTPQAKAFEVSKEEAKLPYEVAFIKAGETALFKKMSTALTFRHNEESRRDISFSLQAMAGEGSPDAELAAIQKKLSDVQAFMKLPPKEQDRLMKRMTDLTELQIKKMSAPDYSQQLQKEQDEFGCQGMMLTVTGANVTGRVNCGKNVGTRGEVKLTGTAAPITPAS
jgi:hypothetical protein